MKTLAIMIVMLGSVSAFAKVDCLGTLGSKSAKREIAQESSSIITKIQSFFQKNNSSAFSSARIGCK